MVCKVVGYNALGVLFLVATVSFPCLVPRGSWAPLLCTKKEKGLRLFVLFLEHHMPGRAEPEIKQGCWVWDMECGGTVSSALKFPRLED